MMRDSEQSEVPYDVIKRIADGIEIDGVVGNDDDLRFDAMDAEVSLPAIAAMLQRPTTDAGGLAVGTVKTPGSSIDTLVYDRARYATDAAAERAWEADYTRRWQSKVNERADDWLRRLQDLRSSMEKWLSTSEFAKLVFADRPPVDMREELMARFGVPAKKMPTFDIRSGDRRVMRFHPRGLWVIGANGRVDLVTRSAAPVLVDLSKPLSASRNWQLYDSHKGRGTVPLNEETFRDLIRSAL